MRVAWFTLEAPGVLIRGHRADDTVTPAITRILRADLVIVDDIGLLPVGPDAAEGLYRLADAAYEKRSIAVSCNLHPSAFDELMPKTLATATVNRLLHHAHLCQTSGESTGLAQALAGAGVALLGGADGRPARHARGDLRMPRMRGTLPRRAPLPDCQLFTPRAFAQSYDGVLSGWFARLGGIEMLPEQARPGGDHEVAETS